MYIIQILLALFFLYAIGKVVARYRAQELTTGLMSAWIVFWIAAIGIVLVPNSTASLAKLVGIGRGADLVVYVSLAAIFFLLFRIIVSQEKMKREITVLTRKIALSEGTKSKE